jgi:hypothetical protein
VLKEDGDLSLDQDRIYKTHTWNKGIITGAGELAVIRRKKNNRGKNIYSFKSSELQSIYRHLILKQYYSYDSYEIPKKQHHTEAIN